jgi:hypothetical protein
MAPREKPGPPMTLGNMRKNGVRAVIAACQACGHKADVNVDALPETIFVPEMSPAPMQLMRGEANRYETRVAYEMIELARRRQGDTGSVAPRSPV